MLMEGAEHIEVEIDVAHEGGAHEQGIIVAPAGQNLAHIYDGVGRCHQQTVVVEGVGSEVYLKLHAPIET